MSKMDVIKKYSLLVDFNCPTFKFENILSYFYEIKMFSKLTVGHFKFNSQFISGSHALTVALFSYLRPGDTMLSINVKDSLITNPIPAISKTIEITAPEINGSTPAQAIVTGKNITSSYKSGVVTIEWTNSTDNDNKIACITPLNFTLVNCVFLTPN